MANIIKAMKLDFDLVKVYVKAICFTLLKRYRRWLYGFDDFNRCRSYSFCRNSKEKSLWEK